jgi:hypothetical protein
MRMRAFSRFWRAVTSDWIRLRRAVDVLVEVEDPNGEGEESGDEGGLKSAEGDSELLDLSPEFEPPKKPMLDGVGDGSRWSR